MCVSGGTKCWFFGKFGVLCFLEIETNVLRFALVPYYRQIVNHYTDGTQKMQMINVVVSIFFSSCAIRQCAFMTITRKGVGVLKFVRRLQILLFIFYGWRRFVWGRGITELVIFVDFTNQGCKHWSGQDHFLEQNFVLDVSLFIHQEINNKKLIYFFEFVVLSVN